MWQAKDLRRAVFGSVANKELSWRFLGSVANTGLTGKVAGDEWLAELVELPSPLRCMGKSAETIDGKGVADAPLRKRVRKHLKAKGIDEERTPRIRSGQERVRKRKKAKELDKDTTLGRL